ncbi:hypothetical protein HDU98_005336 [Podochytrium sp. JEL0797]|nr:hypothetical protein HDU98_005336 [Podochytrium sp. JEL0797]
MDASPSFPLSAYSISWPFISEESLDNRFWNFGGNTIVNMQDESISLTRQKPNQVGWLWSKQQLSSNAWSVEFDFKVHGTTSAFHGDGFAFWYTKEKQEKGSVFGNRDKATGLGVIFDTFKNGKHSFTFPYVSVQIGDGTTGYHFQSDGVDSQAGGCLAPDFRNKNWKTKGKVEYVAGDYLRVSLNVKGEETWEECALIKDVTLPSYGYIGFTSHTGAASDTHDILNVSTNGLPNSKPSSPPRVKSAEIINDGVKLKNDNTYRGGSYDNGNRGLWEQAVLILIGVFAICLVIVGLLMAWKKDD